MVHSPQKENPKGEENQKVQILGSSKSGAGTRCCCWVAIPGYLELGSGFLIWSILFITLPEASPVVASKACSSFLVKPTPGLLSFRLFKNTFYFPPVGCKRNRSLLDLFYSSTAESFGVSAQIGSGVVRAGPAVYKVPRGFHQGSTRAPRGFHAG